MTLRFVRIPGAEAAIFLIAVVALAACESGSGSPSPTPPLASSPTASTAQDSPATVHLESGSALVWGAGEYGVVLVHGAIYDAASWTDQAEAMASAGFVVIAVERATADEVRAAMDYLRRTSGVSRLALIGASAGTGPVLEAARTGAQDQEPAVDLVVILAGSGDVQELSAASVLFIAAEGDAGAASSAERMMSQTSGSADDLLVVPGSAHAQALFREPEGETVLSAILDRLEARREASREP